VTEPAALLRRPSTTRRRRRAIEGYAFVSPWIAGFVLFTLGPMVVSLYLSLNDYAILKPPNFVGLANYQRAIFADDLFWSSLGRTIYYAGVAVPLGIVGSLAAALLLDQRLKGTVLFRTLFFLPSLTPVVASALLWSWIYQPELGPLNYLLGLVRIEGPGWIRDPQWAIPSLIVMALWSNVGGSRMIIFLAGLQGIPRELHDAAHIDGANTWQRFRHVTLPMLSPTVFFNLVIGIIGSLSVFSVAYIATNGGPAYATWFYVLHLFNQAFQFHNMGYASALAWLFFAFVLLLTGVQLKLSGRWVYYGGS